MSIELLGRTRGQDFVLPLASRLNGTYVIGRNGTGKSSLIDVMVMWDLLDNRGLCVLDPHGDLIDNLLGLLAPENMANVIVLDAGDPDVAFGLNLFANDGSEKAISRTADQVVQVFKKAWGEISWGPRLEDLLFNGAYTLASTAGTTLMDFPTLLYDQEYRAAMVERVANRIVGDFWRYDYDPLADREQREIRASVLNKLRSFLSNPYLADIVGQEQDTVDWRSAMDNEKIVLIKLRLSDLGEGPVSLLGSTIIAKILNAGVSRAELSPEDRRPFYLFADEYHRFATPAFATLIEEARKYGIGTLIAHQRRSQLPPEQRAAPLGAWNLFVFQVQGEDAETLSREFDSTPLEDSAVLASDALQHILHHGHNDLRVVQTCQHLEAALIEFEMNLETFFGWREAEHESSYKAWQLVGKEKDASLILRRMRTAIAGYLYDRQCGREGGPHYEQFQYDVLIYCNNHYVESARIERYVQRLGDYLARHPLLISPATLKPVHSTSERQAQIANELTNLPPYTAKVRYRDAGSVREATVAIAPPRTRDRLALRASGKARAQLHRSSDEAVFHDDPPPGFG